MGTVLLLCALERLCHPPSPRGSTMAGWLSNAGGRLPSRNGAGPGLRLIPFGLLRCVRGCIREGHTNNTPNFSCVIPQLSTTSLIIIAKHQKAQKAQRNQGASTDGSRTILNMGLSSEHYAVSILHHPQERLM